MDREKVISNLQGVYEYLRHFENTAKMGEWVADAIALLNEQKAEILQLEAELDILRNIYKQENPYRQAVKFE